MRCNGGWPLFGPSSVLGQQPDPLRAVAAGDSVEASAFQVGAANDCSRCGEEGRAGNEGVLIEGRSNAAHGYRQIHDAADASALRILSESTPLTMRTPAGTAMKRNDQGRCLQASGAESRRIAKQAEVDPRCAGMRR